MTVGDIKLRTRVAPLFTWTPIVAAGAANTIHLGEPTVRVDATAAAATGAVKLAVDGDPLNTSTHNFTGIAKGESTDTVAAAGSVVLWMPLAGIVYEAKAKSAAAADTQAEIDALVYKRVVFDLTASAWTVDTAATDAVTNGVVIIGGDFRLKTLYFLIAPQSTFTTGAAAT